MLNDKKEKKLNEGNGRSPDTSNVSPGGKLTDPCQRYEALEKLRKAAFDNYLRRQTYEWKMCVTIWAPIVAFIGISLMNPHVWMPWIPMIIASIFLAGVHILWQRNLKKSNDIDNSKIRECESDMRGLVGLTESEGPKGFLIFKGWSHWIYITMSLALIAIALYVNGTKRTKIVPLPADIIKALENKQLTDIKERDNYVVKALRSQLGLPSKNPQESTTKEKEKGTPLKN